MHGQNSFQASLQQRRFTEHFRPFQEPSIIRYLRNRIVHIWNDDPAAPRRNELNLILISLMLMIGSRIIMFLSFYLQAVTKKLSVFPIKCFAYSFISIWNNLVDTLSCPFIKTVTVLPDYIWVNTCYKGQSRMVFATVYNIDEKVKQVSQKTTYFDTDTDFVICDNSANIHICNDKSMFTHLCKLTDIRTVATIRGKNSGPSGIGIIKWS